MKRIMIILILILATVLIMSILRELIFYIPYTKPRVEVSIEEPRKSFPNVTLVQKTGRIVFDQVHDNSFSTYEGYSHFASLFKSTGFDVYVVEDRILFNLALEDATALVLVAPNESYTKKERASIMDAVENGLTLILIGDKNRVDALNKISFEYDIIFNNDYVYDLYNNSLSYKYPLISNFVEDEITKNLTEIVIYEGCSLDTFKDSNTIAFAGENARSSEISFEKNLAMLATSSNGKGKIFAICDSEIFTNKNIGKYDNEILAVNIVNWI